MADISILPFDNDDLVQQGIALAVADRLDGYLRVLHDLALSLRGNYAISREEWDRAFADLEITHETLTKPLDWAGCFAEGMDEEPGAPEVW